MKFKEGFSLTEVLVTILIIGAVTAFAVPQMISGTDSYRYAAGLRKAVRDLNDALAYNIANGEKSAYYTNDDDNPLDLYLQKAMPVVGYAPDGIRSSGANSEFYTKDGMRYEIPGGSESGSSEFGGLKITGNDSESDWTVKNRQCGTYGLDIGGSSLAQAVQPCIILVDVNGNDGPNVLTDKDGSVLSDMFLIIITDKSALPYGALAQSTVYDN